MSSQKIVQRLAPGILGATVRIYRGEQLVSRAIAIAPNQVLALRDLVFADMRLLDEQGAMLQIAGVAADDPAAGLAVISIDNASAPLPVNRSVRELEEGLKVVAMGASGSVEENTVVQLLKVPHWVALLQLEQGVPLAPGSPLVNRKSETIGIAFPFLAGANAGYAIPAAYFPDAQGRTPMPLADWLSVRTPSLMAPDVQAVYRQMLTDKAGALASIRKIIEAGSPYAAHRIQAGILAQETGDDAGAEVHYRDATAVEPANATAWRALGEFYNHQNRFGEATQAFEAAYQAEPVDATICFQLASLYTKAGRREEAIAKLTESLRADPEYMPAVLAYGAVLQNLGRYGEAYDVYKRVVRKYADIPDLMLHFGVCAQKSGHLPEAIESLSACLAAEPSNILIHLALTSALLETGQTGRCREVLGETQQRFPDDPRVALQMGLLAKAEGDLAESLRWFEQAQGSGIESPEFFHMLGGDNARLGNFDRAVQHLQRAIDLLPAESAAGLAALYCEMGHAQVAAGRRDEAMQSYGKTIDFDPGNPLGFVFLGREFFKGQQWKEAAMLLRRALELDPTNVEAGMTLGLVLEKQELWGEATDVYTATLAYLPYDADAWFRLAWSQYRGNDRTAAAKTLRKVVKMASGYGPAYFLLGHLQREAGQASEALESYKKAAEHTPGSADPCLQAGSLYLEMGQGRRAAVYYQKAAEIDPDRPEAFSGLAESLLSVGDTQNARAAVERLRAIAPSGAAKFDARLRNSLN